MLGGPRWLTTEDPTGHPVGMVTGAEGGNLVFVKVRETYDLHTTKNKMTVIGIHTPKSDIIKRNFPGLLMQCKAYRPVSADVRIACASMLPLDPQGVGTDVGDVAPEDVFNPILYKAMSNFGMSQLELRINSLRDVAGESVDVDGNLATVDVDSVTPEADEFSIYYGLLSDAHGWKHASPQAGLSMSNLKPLVYEMLWNIGDNASHSDGTYGYDAIDNAGNKTISSTTYSTIRGSGKPMPFINTTCYTKTASNTAKAPGFSTGVGNAQFEVPYLNVFVGAIIVPPSRLHELFYRMVVEWTLEFSAIRTLSEITDWGGLSNLGSYTHYQNYSYESTKQALTGSSDSILDEDACMVSANVDVNKVM